MEPLFTVGQTVFLKPDSDLHRGTYATQVLHFETNLLTVSFPYESGKVVLLGVGTTVYLSTPSGEILEAKVLEKKHGNGSSLVLLLPQAFGPKVRTGGPKVIAVTSGKGGVGKTSFCVNLALALAKEGAKVYLMDADLGTANIDVLLNLQVQYNLLHLVKKEKDILEIAVEAPGGIYVVPGGSGLQQLADLDNLQIQSIINSLRKLEELADYIIIDTGAGLSKSVINFVLAADDIVVLTTPEPHALTDAYAIIKVLNEKNSKLPVRLVVNRVGSQSEAERVAQHLISVIRRFLQIQVESIGYLPEDPMVAQGVKQFKPFFLLSPSCRASQQVQLLARKLQKTAVENEKTQSLSFFDRVKKMFVEP